MKRTRLAKYRSLWKLVIALALVSLVLPGGDASGVGQSRDASEAPVASTLTESGVQQADPGVYVSPPVEPHRVKVDPQSLQVAPSKEVKTVPEGEPLPAGPPPPRAPISDPVIQLTVEGALQDTPPNVEGVGLTSGSDVHMVYLPILMQQQGREPEIGMISDPVVSVPGIATFIPPDTVGDVGTNHYVQMVNATQFRIWDKSGNPLTGAMIFGNLWPAGDPCNSNLGDPIVVFDHLADRWLLSQFFATSFDALGNPLPPFFECIAISQTPDPTAGTWFLYTFEVPNFPDYPKFGVWPDGYYMSSYEFPDLGVYVFDRANMLLGNAARFFRDDIPALGTASVRDTRILPSDLDGPPPPIGTPNYFARPVDDQQDPGSDDRIEVYEARVDWLAPSFTFTLVDTLTPAPFQTMLCSRNGQGIRDCIPQPDEVDTVDALSNRPMMQLKYRAFGTYTAMVFNQTIDVSGSIPDLFDFTPANEVAGIRWYELRKTGANWSIFQQGTFAPQPNGADGETELLHRWMGSAAMDKYGNIALGYSIVNDDDDNGEEVYPGIRYTGRRFDDLPGLMPQGEKIILNGTNSQGNGDGTVDPQRWGDYSAMSVDPVDDCTFWFTAHVAGGLTQIASFRFDTCGTDLSIEKSATPDPATAGAQLSYGITVINNGSNTATDVIVTDVLPPEVTYLADTDSCIEFPVGTLTCSLGDLLPGQTETFTILVEVDADLVANAGGPTTITNSAEVTAEQPDPNLTNNTATVMTLVNELADLRVSKDCKPDRPVLAGDSATCTITVENLGPSTARDVLAVDKHISNGTFEFGSVSSTVGTCIAPIGPQNGSGIVTCDLGDVDPGDVVTIVVEVTADEVQDINDQVTVSSPTPDPDPSNNQAADGVSVVAAADLSITKSDSPDPVVAGTQLTYNLGVANNGPSTAANVVIKDILQAGVTINSVSSTGGNCVTGEPGNPARPTTCAFDSMAPGTSETMQIVVTVPPFARGILHNDAQVSSDTADPDNADNYITVGTTVNAVADLEVTKSANATTVTAGQGLIYEIVITNNGPSTATGVSLVDTLPAEVTFLGATISNGSGTCVLLSVPANTVACDLNDLAPRQFVRVLIEVMVKPNTPDGAIITNTAEADAVESDPDGASTTARTTVNTQADLAITKDALVDYTNPAPKVIYTVVVTNAGASDAQNVVMTDSLPLDPKKIVYLFDTGNGACSYDMATHIVTCNFGTLAAGSSVSVDIYVDVRGSVGVISNIASVTSTTLDPVMSNNSVRKDVIIRGGPGPNASVAI